MCDFFQSFQLFAVLFNILIQKFKSHRKEVIGNVEICRAWKVLFHVDRWSQETIKNNNTTIPILLEFRSLSLIRLFMFCTRLSQANMAKPLLANTRPPEMNEPFLRMDERRLRKTETLESSLYWANWASCLQITRFFWTIIRSKSGLTQNISPIYTRGRQDVLDDLNV